VVKNERFTVDLCLNNTELCIKGQGYCIVNGTQPACKCLKEYSGIKCEIQSTSLAVTKAIISAATIIVIIVLAWFIILVLCCDFIKYFVIKNRFEKKHKKTEIKRFYYHNWNN
jgi:hypothetical protein